MPASLSVGLERYCSSSLLELLHTQNTSDKVQAWPMPLNGAGLIQKKHHVAADETEQRIGEPVHEDE